MAQRPAPVDLVKVDGRRGHICLVRGSDTVATWVDLGPVLQYWQYEGGVEVGPNEARELGAALIAWADRKQHREAAAS